MAKLYCWVTLLDILSLALTSILGYIWTVSQVKDKVHSACSSDHTTWITGNMQWRFPCGLAIHNPQIYLQTNRVKVFSWIADTCLALLHTFTDRLAFLLWMIAQLCVICGWVPAHLLSTSSATEHRKDPGTITNTVSLQMEVSRNLFFKLF